MKRTKPPSANPPKPPTGSEHFDDQKNNQRASLTPKKTASDEGEIAKGIKATISNASGERAKEPQRQKSQAEHLPLGLTVEEPSESSSATAQTRPAETPLSQSSTAKTFIPSILLEGDEPSPGWPAGPDQKFVSGPKSEQSAPENDRGELPESYGTGRLLLAPRDPACLYVHWDLKPEQQQLYLDLPSRGPLLIRVHEESITGPLAAEVPIPAESHHSFININRGGGKYVAELGYQPPGGNWKTIACSDAVDAPSPLAATEEPIRFATLSFTQPLTATEHPTPGAAAAATPTEKPIARPASEFFFAVPAGNATLEFPLPGSMPDEHIQVPVGRQTPPAVSVPVIAEPEVFESEIMASVLCPAPISEWTESQESALAEFIDWPSIASEWISSGEIEELIKPKMQPAGALPLGLFSPTASVPTPAPFSSGELSAIPPLERQNFWLNVNAELVIYGATAPDAKVTIAGRQIRLRQDGTFSYRFALPDGSYPLPITAVSQQGDLRQAELDFYRGTSYSGEVGAQPQDPALKPPLPQNVS